MNKSELISNIAFETDIAKLDAERVVNAVLDAIATSLQQGEDVALQGFGTFSVKTRKARTGRNPQTGESLQIPASQHVGFKPGKALKTAVRSKEA